ncbi:MAG: Crp/Fnr family transcriptional regulator [Pyrinomonadaceae bacterium]
MKTESHIPFPISNRLLGALPDEEFQHLVPHLEPVSLSFGEVLYQSGERVRHVYFLGKDTVASLIITMKDGKSVEAGVIGSEGMVGIQSFLRADSTPNRVVVQVAGSALRVQAAVLREEFNRGGVLQDLLLRYTHALFTEVLQAAACNHLHSVEERLSRWLLMIDERATMNDLPLTQELMSRRLGAHRSSIGEAAGSLQQKGLIRYLRGRITLLDTGALKAVTCECYAIVKEEFGRALVI